jgi:hypothetical protein
MSTITCFIGRRPHFIIASVLLLILTAFLGEANPALAQAPVTAEVDRSTLSTDEQLLLTISVRGDILNLPAPDLTAVTDFTVVGSSTATQVSIINGQLTSEGRLIYRLQPLRAGKLTIPPISVEFDGQIYQTQPFEIEVLPGAAPAVPPGQDIPSTEAPHTLSGQNFFVEAEVDKPNPYLGEQIIYTFRLYQASNFLGQPDYQPPAFIDFWGQTTLSQPTYRTQADGRDYLITEIRTALFPANIGPVTIAPAKFVIPGGLFEPDVVLDTEPVTVNVKSWPDGAPKEFNGAVGQFQMKTFLEEKEGKVNEPLTLIIEIEGAGNIEILNEPALPELRGWRLFESEVSTTTEVRDDIVYGTRRFKRLIVPSKPGRQTLPSINFSYYDPQAAAYQTLTSDPISINILAGDSESGFQPVASPDDQSTALSVNDIRHIKPVPASLRRSSISLLAHPLYWGCWVLPVLVVAGGWILQKRRRRLQSDNAYARSYRARRIAHQILTEAQHTGQDSYAAAQRALLGYLSDKLNRPTAGLTTDNLIQLLHEAQLDPRLVERVRVMLDQMDIGRFAPIDASGQTLLSDTKALINALEKAFGVRS